MSGSVMWPVMRPARRAAAGIVLLVLLLATAGGAWQMQEAVQRRERGAALFHGERPLVARLQGHSQPLPMQAVRCANCHEAPSVAPVGIARAVAVAASTGLTTAPRPYAGTLAGAALATPRPRRGGPPSAYDAARLCTLLSTGVDPAQVMIPNTMPRYEPTDDDCADLWAYLVDDTR